MRKKAEELASNAIKQVHQASIQQNQQQEDLYKQHTKKKEIEEDDEDKKVGTFLLLYHSFFRPVLILTSIPYLLFHSPMREATMKRAKKIKTRQKNLIQLIRKMKI